MHRFLQQLVMACVCTCILSHVPVSAKEDPAPYTYRPGDRGEYVCKDGNRVQVLPDRFLREYDPVTFFFSGKVGGVEAGPEDTPEKWVTITPAHPGEYRWIDRKTLEFRPTVPWPPVSSFTVKVGNVSHPLKTLLATPRSVTPSHGTTDLGETKRITIEFAYPVPVALLKKLVSFEVTPLPGIDRDKSVFFGAADYSVKTGEQKKNGAVAYTFLFRNSFPLANKIRTHVQLSDIPEFSEGKKVYWFSTKTDFRLIRAGTYNAQFNIGANGSNYSVDQALTVDQSGQIVLDFSSQPKNISLSQAKSLFMFSPAPRSFSFSQNGNRLVAKVDLEPERLYKVTLQPVRLKDHLDRIIRMDSPSSFYVSRNPDRKYIRWEKSFGILERFGPQHLPLALANINAFDLRVYKIDPLHKAFFPFPASPVTVDEGVRPPGPGEEPRHEELIHNPLNPSSIVQHIQMLGSPHFSEVISAPGEGILKEQTLDLKKKLAKISGSDAPGTYLLGFRELSGKTGRQYVKVMVTDLCLTTVEARNEVMFCVTSLNTGKPLSGVEVRIEGMFRDTFSVFNTQKTDRDGMCTVPRGALYDSLYHHDIRRVVLKNGDDCLVLDSRERMSPPRFVNKHWENYGAEWLQTLIRDVYDMEKERELRAFVFPERPIYRPEEKVYIKGYIRSVFGGKVEKVPSGNVELKISGPENEWSEYMTLSEVGSFNYTFKEDDPATGQYTISVLWSPEGDGGARSVASAKFRVDAYRVPRFEVKLSGEDQVPNDQPFSTNLTASYYAGGRVIDCKAEWKVQVFPYTWTFKGWEEWALSSDSRFGRCVSSTGFGTVNEEMKTDDDGGARLVLKPEASLGANPVKYLIEATVTDVDEQTVTDVHSVVALPPFVLALNTDRYVTGSSVISADVAAVSCVTGKPVAGQEVKVTLKRMTWHSYLQETDFARSEPRYVTEENVTVVDEKTVSTEGEPLELQWKDREPGVYVIELSTTDKLGRLQTLKLDLFVAGTKPVVWDKSRQNVFETVADKKEYAPGDVAKIILKSPYQRGTALAVVEHPDGRPRYSWVQVKDGQAEFKLPVEGCMIPKIPVSFMLMRPRISASRRLPGGGYIDAGKPESVGNTTWLSVKPVENQVMVTLSHEKVQAPGDTMTLKLNLTDWKGKPVRGEVTLWLVDQAVLSLGEEMNLDPISSFIPNVSSHIVFRDTRNMALGKLRDFENPGGDEAEEDAAADVKITVRKNFKTVPYYKPSIQVGKKGAATVRIPLPDNLTRFAIRAVAVSGIERFGLSKSSIAVRLPVIVQPSFPRFVRIGDRFKAGGVARVVDGSAGSGSFSFETDGLKIVTKKKHGVWHNLDFPGKKAQPVYLDIQVPDVPFTGEGKLSRDSIMLQMAVRKKGSSKGDAFRVHIPLRSDRRPVTRTLLGMIKKDSLFSFPPVKDKVRGNTLLRQFQVSNELPLLAVLGGLRYLIEYPHGCTEQRVSRAYPSLVYQDMWRQLGLQPLDPDIDKYVRETIKYLERVQDENGLFAYWPGRSGGKVHLTAYAVEFLTAVKKYADERDVDYGFNATVYDRAVAALERSLRTDYSLFLDGYKYYERCAAILALVNSGKKDMAYLEQLATQAQDADIESRTRIYSAIVGSELPMEDVLKDIEKSFWKAMVFKKKKGVKVFAGLQSGSSRIGAVVHSSGITSLASLVGALSRRSSKPKKVAVMANTLVGYGGQNGWGNTHNNGIALLALHDHYESIKEKGKDAAFSLTLGGRDSVLTLEGEKGMLVHSFSVVDAGTLACTKKCKKDSFFVKLFERWVPQEPGSMVRAEQEGFVVKRQIVYPSDTGGPSRKVWIDTAGHKIPVTLGSIVEEHVQVTNPKSRSFVAVIIPLAAGVEYCNPELKTASREFTPEGRTSNSGSYTTFLDDRMVYYFTTMSKGTYDFYFRVRATTEGVFTQPPARAEMMYEEECYGNSTGASVVVR